MPALDWVNKNQAKETTREVPNHLRKQESARAQYQHIRENARNMVYVGRKSVLNCCHV